FLDEHCTQENQLLRQPADQNRSIPGFLDDYAFCIDAYISLYEATFDEKWCYKAQALCDRALTLFYDKTLQTFYYTSHDTEIVVARKSEVMDNVIPSSSSTMVRQLHKLGLLFDHDNYTQTAEQIFANVRPHMKSYGSAYSNWGIHLLEMTFGIWEIIISGEHSLACI